MLIFCLCVSSLWTVYFKVIFIALLDSFKSWWLYFKFIVTLTLHILNLLTNQILVLLKYLKCWLIPLLLHTLHTLKSSFSFTHMTFFLLGRTDLCRNSFYSRWKGFRSFLEPRMKLLLVMALLFSLKTFTKLKWFSLLLVLSKTWSRDCFLMNLKIILWSDNSQRFKKVCWQKFTFLNPYFRLRIGSSEN